MRKPIFFLTFATIVAAGLLVSEAEAKGKRKNDNGKVLEFFKVTMTHVTVSNVSRPAGGSTGDRAKLPPTGGTLRR